MQMKESVGKARMALFMRALDKSGADKELLELSATGACFAEPLLIELAQYGLDAPLTQQAPGASKNFQFKSLHVDLDQIDLAYAETRHFQIQRLHGHRSFRRVRV